ncbi:unnamed protein product [Tenebrio molitor]|nr:unnamed protein product [Tenebrio molitor]
MSVIPPEDIWITSEISEDKQEGTRKVESEATPPDIICLRSKL